MASPDEQQPPHSAGAGTTMVPEALSAAADEVTVSVIVALQRGDRPEDIAKELVALAVQDIAGL